VPAEFVFVKALPKAGAGKVDKPRIRALHDPNQPKR
jgi:acyl-CoA synthetase (AMP-forming)/AMP-acid ligase II